MAVRTRTTRTPAFWGYSLPPHDYPYHSVILDPKSKEDKVKVTNLKNSPKFQIFEFWNGHYTWHTFLSCLIRCANMKWIRWVLLKIQSGHDFVHRRTDGQTDKVIPVYPLSTSLKRGYNKYNFVNEPEKWWNLTHWGRHKMAAIFHTTFSNAFSWMNMYEFHLRFHWNLFLRFKLTIFQHWFR